MTTSRKRRRSGVQALLLCLCSIVCLLSLGRYRRQMQSFAEVSELRKPVLRPKLSRTSSSASFAVLSLRQNITHTTSSSPEPKANHLSLDPSKQKSLSHDERNARITDHRAKSNLNVLPVIPIRNLTDFAANTTHPVLQSSSTPKFPGRADDSIVKANVLPVDPVRNLTDFASNTTHPELKSSSTPQSPGIADDSIVKANVLLVDPVRNLTDFASNTAHPLPQSSSTPRPPENATDSTIKANPNSAASSKNDTNALSTAKSNKAELQPLDWSLVEGDDAPITPFVRYEKVVVATKVHGPDMVGQLMQMLCLFTAAYNRHVNYDIVVFTTLPWEPQTMQQVQAVVPHTKLTFQIEGPPLQEQIEALTPGARAWLMSRCNVTAGENITWEHLCNHGSWVPKTRLNYAWQAEFRSYHIWTMPVLTPYKYMIWMDTDALCSKPWPHDPLKLMVERDLVLMFDNFPGGITKNPQILLKMYQSYQRSICQLTLNDRGQFLTSDECLGEFRLPQVHGFHHITNLDFYRNETNLRFLKNFVEPHRFNREWDDQMAVTIPAAVQAPERVADYRLNGLNLSIFHNNEMDGRYRPPNITKGYISYWQSVVRSNWDLGRKMCDSYIRFTGR